MKMAPLLLLLPVLACACTATDPGFGETHRWNLEQQIVDPDPQYAGTEIEGGSGERAASAVDRYNRGQVKQPTAVLTTDAGSGASSSSGTSPPQ